MTIIDDPAEPGNYDEEFVAGEVIHSFNEQGFATPDPQWSGARPNPRGYRDEALIASPDATWP